MQIGLIDVDSKIPNLALMKISAYHKAKGDTVKMYDPLFDIPDMVCASKIFDFTPDYQYFPSCEIIKGGTGYDLTTKLPPEIEGQFPDYSLYNCDYAIGHTTRGCVRDCSFCVVPRKEGKIRVVGDIYDFWNGQDRLMILDNNLTALPIQFERICQQLIKHRIKTDFNQGLDIRLVDDDKAELLSRVRLWKQIHFAFDSPDTEEEVIRGIKILTQYMPASRLAFYVLIGYDTTPEQDIYRVDLLRSMKVDPFVMPFNKADRYQKNFARWVNRKAVFKTCTWDEYKKGRGYDRLNAV